MEIMMEHFLQPDTYALWSKNENIRYHSTSGGAFTEFAKIIIADGGKVAGAEYNNECMVVHVLVSDIEGLERLRQSKYLASNLNNIYREIKDVLNSGIEVGFCGSPCQVAGLYSFLGKEYKNLTTIDFICRGMNSPKAYRAWLNEIETQEKSKAKKVWFKYKDGGWKTSPTRTRVDFEDGHYKVYENDKNLFMYGYLSSNLYIKPSCGDCKFKGVPRLSDITLADFWGVEKKFDDDKGTSLVLVNSEKGRELFERVKENVHYYKRDFSEIFAGNIMFTDSVPIPENAHEFLKDLDIMSFSDALKKHGAYPYAVSFNKKVVRKIKSIIKKLIKL